ncbi:hypothetical protein Scep_018731 [Stephania cephalantha]|uniref:Uncharacterized protein n=1 Tax=Stephania cephalantha TaxID=152367 RepID=A0AAP0I9P7_9MAGN
MDEDRVFHLDRDLSILVGSVERRSLCQYVSTIGQRAATVESGDVALAYIGEEETDGVRCVRALHSLQVSEEPGSSRRSPALQSKMGRDAKELASGGDNDDDERRRNVSNDGRDGGDLARDEERRLLLRSSSFFTRSHSLTPRSALPVPDLVILSSDLALSVPDLDSDAEQIYKAEFDLTSSETESSRPPSKPQRSSALAVLALIPYVLGRLVRIGELVDQEVKGKQKMVKKFVLRIQINREPLSKEVQLIRDENENFNIKAETMTVEEVKRQRSKATVQSSYIRKECNPNILLILSDIRKECNPNRTLPDYVVVAPPFMYIEQVKNSLTDRIEISAHNSWVGKGENFTGEIRKLNSQWDFILLVSFILFSLRFSPALALKKSYVVYLGGHSHGPERQNP